MAKNFLKSSLQNASFNIIFQIMFRCLTFVMNAFVLRHVEQDVIGVMNVRLLLLESTILFLSREAFRRACLTNTMAHNWAQVINLLWLTVPLCSMMCVLFGWIWLSVLETPDSKITAHYTIGVYAIAISCVVEMCVEPLYLVAQAFLFVRLRVVMDTINVIVRTTVFTTLVLWWPKGAVVAFSAAQIAAVLVYAACYYLYFAQYLKERKHVPRKLQRQSSVTEDDFPFTSMTEFLPQWKENEPLVDLKLCVLTWSFFKQGILKQILTEGERYVMTLFSVLSFYEQGVFDVVNNLGSLAARFLFRPIEESAYFYFSQLVNRDKSIDDQNPLLYSPSSRSEHGHDVVSLLTLLINYRKHEAANPYIVKLSILDNELALNGYGQVITWSLNEFCRQFCLQQSEPQTGNWLTSLSTMVGSMFISDEGGIRTQQMRANNGLLLALYEAVHLNRNFVTTLAHSQMETSVPPSPPPVPGELIETPQPSNLLVTFFQYCSIVMQDTRSETSVSNVKLCFIILTCITEDQYANSLMHDVNLTFKVQLHRLPMRHRKFVPEKASQPLASTLMDLLVEFIMSHMMKKLSLELYLQCTGVIHRVLCYQKRCRVRLLYQWKELWTALITLLKFILANENHLAKKMNIFLLALQVVNIFNLFITYGDTFLPSPSSYDELYYELIRMHQVFDNIYSTAFRYSTIDGEFKDTALSLTNSLINVRAIINHFTPKIDAWLEGQALSTPSEDEILEVVRKNYDSLTLKLQDSLDQYERYTENPQHSAFFTSMVRNVVIDTRQNIDYASLDLQAILQELSCIA